MTSKWIWGFSIGLVAGLLLAPEKGSETRRKVRRRAHELKDRFDDFVDAVSDRIESFKNDAEGVAKKTRSEAEAFAGDVRNGVM